MHLARIHAKFIVLKQDLNDLESGYHRFMPTIRISFEIFQVLKGTNPPFQSPLDITSSSSISSFAWSSNATTNESDIAFDVEEAAVVRG